MDLYNSRVGGGGGGEAGVLTHYKSEQEEEEGVYGGDPGTQLFFMGFFNRAGGGRAEAQAVFSRSCMAFCCVSFSVDTHCVHNPADT